MDKILSISIASYNIEKYVNETLGSFVISEVLKDIEVIVVNDGSKDKTSELAYEFSKKYPDTFVVIDKANGGYGSTINASTRIARGKYFKTVDGDDWVDKQGFIKLVNYLKTVNDDMVVTNFARVNDKNKKMTPTRFHCRGYEKTFLFEDMYDDQELFMQALTIKTEILKQLQLEITEHCFYTDIEYILTPVPMINTISFLDEYVYMYRVAVNEQSMSVAGKRKHIDEQLKIYKKMTALYNSVKSELGKGKQRFFIIILSEMYKSHITAILSLKISDKSKKRLLEIEKYTKKQVNDIYQETYKYKTIKVLRKTNYLTYSIGSILYKIYQKVLVISGR